MREAFSSLGAHVLPLIAIVFALMLGMAVYHELGEFWFVIGLLLALALISLAVRAVWLHLESPFPRLIGNMAAAKQAGKGAPATRLGAGAGGGTGRPL
ncbi:MAG: hypothetical protein AAB654_24770 [Acidobacteriota bacterium]